MRAEKFSKEYKYAHQKLKEERQKRAVCGEGGKEGGGEEQERGRRVVGSQGVPLRGGREGHEDARGVSKRETLLSQLRSCFFPLSKLRGSKCVGVPQANEGVGPSAVPPFLPWV